MGRYDYSGFGAGMLAGFKTMTDMLRGLREDERAEKRMKMDEQRMAFDMYMRNEANERAQITHDQSTTLFKQQQDQRQADADAAVALAEMLVYAVTGDQEGVNIGGRIDEQSPEFQRGALEYLKTQDPDASKEFGTPNANGDIFSPEFFMSTPSGDGSVIMGTTRNAQGAVTSKGPVPLTLNRSSDNNDQAVVIGTHDWLKRMAENTLNEVAAKNNNDPVAIKKDLTLRLKELLPHASPEVQKTILTQLGNIAKQKIWAGDILAGLQGSGTELSAPSSAPERPQGVATGAPPPAPAPTAPAPGIAAPGIAEPRSAAPEASAQSPVQSTPLYSDEIEKLRLKAEAGFASADEKKRYEGLTTSAGISKLITEKEKNIAKLEKEKKEHLAKAEYFRSVGRNKEAEIEEAKVYEEENGSAKELRRDLKNMVSEYFSPGSTDPAARLSLDSYLSAEKFELSKLMERRDQIGDEKKPETSPSQKTKTMPAQPPTVTEVGGVEEVKKVVNSAHNGDRASIKKRMNNANVLMLTGDIKTQEEYSRYVRTGKLEKPGDWKTTVSGNTVVATRTTADGGFEVRTHPLEMDAEERRKLIEAKLKEQRAGKEESRKKYKFIMDEVLPDILPARFIDQKTGKVVDTEESRAIADRFIRTIKLMGMDASDPATTVILRQLNKIAERMEGGGWFEADLNFKTLTPAVYASNLLLSGHATSEEEAIDMARQFMAPYKDVDSRTFALMANLSDVLLNSPRGRGLSPDAALEVIHRKLAQNPEEVAIAVEGGQAGRDLILDWSAEILEGE